MKLVFKNETFSFEFLRVLGSSIYGGADISECFTTAARIKDKDFESWYQEWSATAARIERLADDCLERGHGVSAREAYLRACNYYRSAEFFLHIEPDDPRAAETYAKSLRCFRQALPLLPFPGEEVRIPYEGTTLPGYFFRADASHEPRPTLIWHTGYDGTAEEIYIAHAQPFLQRGYNCLIFEGPGQGQAIRLQGLPFRPDWEKVVTPVVDYALSRSEVDPRRLALFGLSLGGYLAPRAAAYEHRLAACIAVDGLFSFSPAAAEQLEGQTEQQATERFEQLAQEPGMRWAIGQAVFTMQVTSPGDFRQKMAAYTMAGRADKITCPTLVCEAEKDHFFPGQPRKLYDALTCPKTFMRFTAAEGGEEHGHAGALALANQRIADWLDETLSHNA
ncbi:alpha/beta fold hydrolase [Ktedonosporobacter rubrisoli]|uniref:Alpha/beta fold hydrolase n=1 Tax=Ktedonosporobacter rubrisoli TaxID=2509675 RepID=A0A4P6JLU3_KTERU|nr:alpha/beta fold hydrolase [Ktedonosporobacter rubrisoli]QBD76053.1 alpha/beta fold hydrolase [Ktedonosporobacter rubrisoli]